MRIFLIMPLILFLFIIQSPAWGYSPSADEFILACRQTEAPFPPEGFSMVDLHNAALEVLDSYESGNEESWVLGFCLRSLAYASYGEDIPRILAYEDELPRTVLRAMFYCTSPESIECFMRHLDSENITERELSLMGLQNMKYSELTDAGELLNNLGAKLYERRNLEPKERLLELIDGILNSLAAMK